MSGQNKTAKMNSAINVTPMVDVMLVLLIIFMVITPMLQPHGAPIDLVKANHPREMAEANKTDALIVAIMRDGKIFLGSQSVTGEVLTQKVRDELRNRANKTVYVRADARARYGVLVNAVDDLRSAGVDQLGLLTERKKATTL